MLKADLAGCLKMVAMVTGINRENFLIIQEFVPVKIANVIIRWHNLLGMQHHIQNFVGK